MNDKADSMNRRSIQLVLGLLLATGFAQAQDTTPPMLLSAGSLIGADIGVCFSEAMDEFSIQNLAAYAVSDSSGTAEIAGVTTWPGNQAVVLHLSRPVTGPFTVRASDLYDLAFNSLPPGSVVTGRISTLGFESGTVGAPAGSAFLSCEADRLAVEGNDMFSDTSDQIEWLYVRRTNDFDVNVRVEQVSGPQSALPRCGLMVRGSSDPGSPMVRLIADATNQSWGVLFYIKRLRQDSERNGFWGEAVDYPVWLRIKRQRSLVSAYGSSNAVDWVRLGGPEPLRNLPPVVMIGLVTVTSEFGSATSATYCGFGDTRLWPEATIQLIQQPAPTTVEEHQTASFVARAEVSGAPADELCFQWQAESSPGSGTFTNIFLATAPRHTTTPLGPTDSGTGFRVIVSLSGGPKVISAPATVTVLPDRTGPRIVAARAANDLQTILLTFSEPLSYQWQRDIGAGFTDVTGANANDYVFVPAVADYGSRFRCLLYAPGSTLTSAVVTLTVVLPGLSITRAGTNIVLSWPGDGVLQEATSINDSWADSAGTTNPRILPAATAHRFYRLRSM